jgi:hypothetical protein
MLIKTLKNLTVFHVSEAPLRDFAARYWKEP